MELRAQKVQKAETYSTETPPTTAEGTEAFKIGSVRRYATAQLHNSIQCLAMLYIFNFVFNVGLSQTTIFLSLGQYCYWEGKYNVFFIFIFFLI